MYNDLLNSIFRKVQKRHPGALMYFPSKISIETGNICNLRCPLCPTNDEAQKGVRKGFMSFEDFKTVFDKVKPFVRTMDLFSWGEPFLNGDITRMIEYAKKEKPSVRLFIDSNLNILSDEQARSIVRSGLDVLKVSCDGATREIYEKYRVGGDLDKVLENVKKVIEKKKEARSETPRIIWKYLVFSHNRHEVEKARAMADEMGVGFEASGMRVDCGKEIFEDVASSVERDKEWIPDDPEYNNYGDLSHGKTFCEKPWRTLTVNWTGDVVPCGAIYNCEKYSFGNLFTQSFAEVWNSGKFMKARKIICGTAGPDPDIICSVCKDNGYQFF